MKKMYVLEAQEYEETYSNYTTDTVNVGVNDINTDIIVSLVSNGNLIETTLDELEELVKQIKLDHMKEN